MNKGVCYIEKKGPPSSTRHLLGPINAITDLLFLEKPGGCVCSAVGVWWMLTSVLVGSHTKAASPGCLATTPCSGGLVVEGAG